jgi:branched-chain amino acid transport system substrate-binding protein
MPSLNALNRRIGVAAAAAVMAALVSTSAAWAQTKKPAGEPIVIGQTAALEGVLAPANIEYNRGVLAHFKEVNAAGGVFGRPLKFVSVNDNYDVEQAKSNLKRLLDQDKAFALMGIGGTPVNAALNPLIADAKVPHIGPVTGADNLRTPVNPYVFNVRASYGNELGRLVDQLSTIGQKKVAVIYSDNAFGKAMLGAFSQMASAKGLQVVPALVGDGDGEVEKATKLIADAQVQAFVSLYASSSKNGIEMVKSLRRATPSTPGYTMSLLGSAGVIALIGDSATNLTVSQVVPFPFSARSVLVQRYHAAMRKSGDPKFSHGSLEGYVAASVLTTGLKAAGSPPSRERFVAALEAKRIDLGGFELNFTNGSRNGTRYTDLVIVGGGGRFTQ